MRLPEETQARLGWPSEQAGEPTGGPFQSRRKQQDFGNKFHRAAMDGYVDMLCEATRRDTNQAALDHHLQLTPTLVAAQCGQLEALRILVGRGGDPERATSRGSSALHLAASRNHLNCVSFLVNFGVNMWALDNELRTAKDVAAIEQSKEVLEYLDQMMAKQSAINTKLVQKLKDKAKGAAEKRLKQMRKLQLKAIKQVERDERLLAKMSQGRRLLKSAHSMGDIKLVGRKCVDLNSLNLLARGDKKPTETSQQADQTIASYIQQRRQDDLLAGGRRLRQRQQLSLSAASQHRAADNKDVNSTVNSASSSSSYPPSSVGSTSGYLSSCSARSILKSASTAATPGGSGGNNKNNKRPSVAQVADCRPRYSDLVAVKCGELRNGRESQSSRQAAKDSASSSVSSSSVSSGGSLLAAKLRVLGGGVSRKVHLKRLLFASANPNGREIDERARESEHDDRAAALKRTRSEPDFGAALRQDRDESDEEQDDEAREEEEEEEEERGGQTERQGGGRRNRVIASSETTRGGDEEGQTSQATVTLRLRLLAPPSPPPLPPAHEDQRQLLLTQCLSQLKFEQQHQHATDGESACLGGGLQGIANSQQQQFSHSDELLQHQLTAGEFPLRPSVIKHQQQRRQQRQQREQQQQPTQHEQQQRRSASVESGDRRPSVSAADSIGSAGSFLARNSPETTGALVQTPPTSNSHSSSASNYHVPSQRTAAQSPHSSASSQASNPVKFDGALDCQPPVDANNNIESDLEQVDPQLDAFLERHNLVELRAVLARERIDFEALLLLDETDLKSLNLLLGPRRKLLNAIDRHKNGLLETPPIGSTSQQRVHMVDTQF